MRAVFFLFALTGAYGISEDYLQGKDLKKVGSQEFVEYEAKLDKQIQDLNKEIEKYILLTRYQVNLTPARVSYRVTEEFIELSTFVEKVNHTKIHTIQTKTLRVFYNGSKFIKSQIIIANQNYDESSYYTDAVVDADPSKLSRDDVEILSKFLDRLERLRVGDIENSVVVPSRLRLKKEFYVPTLQYFHNLLRLTHEYQVTHEKRKEGRLLNEFTRSKRY